MKDFAKFFFFQVAILVIMIILLVVTAVSYKISEKDSILLNDYIQTVKENWDDPSALEKADPGTEMLLLDKNNKVLYASSDTRFEGIRSVPDAEPIFFAVRVCPEIRRNIRMLPKPA